MLFDLQLRNGSNFLLFWFRVVNGGDLVQVESFNNTLKDFASSNYFGIWSLGTIFSSFLAIEGPCIAITYLWLVG
jgi:hypothetical protein